MKKQARSDRLWSIDEVSYYLGIPVATLYKWSHLGIGPRVFGVGRHLRYDPDVVRQWLYDDAA